MKASDMTKAPPRAAGDMGMGSPELTIKMKKAYDQMNAEMQMNGQGSPAWADWLQSQGYDLDSKGLVVKSKQ